MKFLVSILLMAFLSFAACLYLPWWSIALVCFIVSLVIPQRPIFAFLSGFIGLFLLWVLLTAITSTNNNHLLAHRVSILIIGMDSPLVLILISGVLGGIIGGLASLSASFLVARKQVRTEVVTTEVGEGV
jgi:hypothetical protein